jgi:hypothetical protein
MECYNCGKEEHREVSHTFDITIGRTITAIPGNCMECVGCGLCMMTEGQHRAYMELYREVRENNENI